MRNVLNFILLVWFISTGMAYAQDSVVLNLDNLKLKHSTKFNKEKWQNRVERSEMLGDLLDTTLVSKLTVEETRAILGQPDLEQQPGIWKFFLDANKNLFLEAHFASNPSNSPKRLQTLQVTARTNRIGFSDWYEIASNDKKYSENTSDELIRRITAKEEFALKTNLNSVLNSLKAQKFQSEESDGKLKKQTTLISKLLNANSIIGMNRNELTNQLGHSFPLSHPVEEIDNSVFYLIEGRCYLQCVLKNESVSNFRLIFVGPETNFYSSLKPAMKKERSAERTSPVMN